MKNRNDTIARIYDVMMAAAVVPSYFALRTVFNLMSQSCMTLYATGNMLGASAMGVGAYVVPAVATMVGVYQGLKLDREVRAGHKDPLGIGRALEKRGILAPSRDLKQTAHQRTQVRENKPKSTSEIGKYHAPTENRERLEEIYATTGQVSYRPNVQLANRSYPDLKNYRSSCSSSQTAGQLSQQGDSTRDETR